MRFLLLAALAALALAAPKSKIESRLASTLTTKGSANVLVSFHDSVSSYLQALQPERRHFSTHGERTTFVAHSLMAFAASSQKEAAELLSTRSVAHEVFWITNQIYIRDASAQLVKDLAALSSVKEISEEFWIQLEQPIQEEEKGRTGVLAEWGIENIEAHLAWELPGGNNGVGAVVGIIDTGANVAHQDLAGAFRGTEYGWRDVTLFGTQTPRDDHGHGTHVTGTICGANGIGVAPGAKFIACKALNAQGGGTNAGLVSCGQWMNCPTLPDTSLPDCTKAPHIVSNSWGGGQANPFYNDVINAWKASGIVPVFANGNSGPACTTANSPADSLAGVIGVGATTNTNGLAEFSSKGPTMGGRQKPDISAPGQGIRSAWIGGTDQYNTISGTSMATPHVAGVVALLKAREAGISYPNVVALLEAHTNRNVTTTGMNCGGIDESQFPNMAFGYGILNAKNSLQAAIDGKY